ncbi:MAG: hypothetical protein Fur0046_00500 [Cyanobacteria bacterium J069]
MGPGLSAATPASANQLVNRLVNRLDVSAVGSIPQPDAQFRRQLSDSSLENLPENLSENLRLPYATATAAGVTISGENGRFVGQVVINGSSAAAWAVLTDYNNFATFLPNVESSRLLSRNGNQVTFEQVNVLRVASLPVRNRVTIASAEQRPSQIQFVVMDGDEQVMQGVWQIQQASARQLVLTHQVVISPRSDLMRDVYSRVYRGELETTLVSLRREIERRSR